MDDVVFVSVGFGEKYIEQQDRLKESILAIYPNANLLFFRDRLPAKSKQFFDSLYGFKVHAIQEALEFGFKKVIWFDPAMILVDKIDNLLDYWMVAVKDDNKLHNCISVKACNFFKTSSYVVEQLGWNLVGGSLYYFNFHDMRVRSIFILWKESEEAGCFGSQVEAASEQLQGHRYDEACLALSMYGHHLHPVSAPEVRYCIENNPMFIKKHFK